MRAILAWFGSTLGKVVAILLAILIIFGVWKWQSIADALHLRKYNAKMASADVHGANADTAMHAADTLAAHSSVLSRDFNALTNSPEVRNNPVATRVAASGHKVIATKNAEIGSLRTAVAEKTKQVADVKAAGEKPIPRVTPYAYIGYSVSVTKRYGVPVVKAGVDYRLPLISFASLNGEVSYEPPPAPKPGETTDKAEIRVTVGARIHF